MASGLDLGLPPHHKTILDIIDLLVEIDVTQFAKNLGLKGILTFRQCSRTCRDQGDKLLERCPGIVLTQKTLYYHLSRIFKSIVIGHADHTAFLHLIAKTCRNLRILDLAETPCVTVEVLSEILQNNPLLERLKIYGWTPNSPSEADHQFAVNCKKLVHFHVASCDGDFIEMLNLHNSHLLTVRFDRVYISPEVLESFLGKQPCLRSIYLKCNSGQSTCLRSVLLTVARVCRDLESLYIMDRCNRGVDDETIMKIAKECPKMKKFLIHTKCQRLLTKPTYDYLNSKEIFINTYWESWYSDDET